MELLMLASFLLTDKGFLCFFHDSFLRPVILGSFTRVPLFFFFKVFIEFVAVLRLFYVFVFWPGGMWHLSFPTRDRTHHPCTGRQS